MRIVDPVEAAQTVDLVVAGPTVDAVVAVGTIQKLGSTPSAGMSMTHQQFSSLI